MIPPVDRFGFGYRQVRLRAPFGGIGSEGDVINLRPLRVDPGTRPPLFDWSTEGTTVPLNLSPFEWQYLVSTLRASAYPAAHELADGIESQIRQHLGTDRHPAG